MLGFLENETVSRQTEITFNEEIIIGRRPDQQFREEKMLQNQDFY